MSSHLVLVKRRVTDFTMQAGTQVTCLGSLAGEDAERTGFESKSLQLKAELPRNTTAGIQKVSFVPSSLALALVK